MATYGYRDPFPTLSGTGGGAGRVKTKSQGAGRTAVYKPPAPPRSPVPYTQQAQTFAAPAKPSYSYDADPILNQIAALSTQEEEDARAHAGKLQQQLTVDYGDPTEATRYGGPDLGIAAAENKNSIYAQLARGYEQGLRQIENNLNAQNLWYSGARIKQSGDYANDYESQRANALASLRGQLGTIQGNLAASVNSARLRRLQAEQEAAARAAAAAAAAAQIPQNQGGGGAGGGGAAGGGLPAGTPGSNAIPPAIQQPAIEQIQQEQTAGGPGGTPQEIAAAAEEARQILLNDGLPSLGVNTGVPASTVPLEPIIEQLMQEQTGGTPITAAGQQAAEPIAEQVRQDLLQSSLPQLGVQTGNVQTPLQIASPAVAAGAGTVGAALANQSRDLSSGYTDEYTQTAPPIPYGPTGEDVVLAPQDIAYLQEAQQSVPPGGSDWDQIQQALMMGGAYEQPAPPIPPPTPPPPVPPQQTVEQSSPPPPEPYYDPGPPVEEYGPSGEDVQLTPEDVQVLQELQQQVEPGSGDWDLIQLMLMMGGGYGY